MGYDVCFDYSSSLLLQVSMSVSNMFWPTSAEFDYDCSFYDDADHCG